LLSIIKAIPEKPFINKLAKEKLNITGRVFKTENTLLVFNFRESDE